MVRRAVTPGDQPENYRRCLAGLSHLTSIRLE